MPLSRTCVIIAKASVFRVDRAFQVKVTAPPSVYMYTEVICIMGLVKGK